MSLLRADVPGAARQSINQIDGLDGRCGMPFKRGRQGYMRHVRIAFRCCYPTDAMLYTSPKPRFFYCFELLKFTIEAIAI